MPLNGVRLHICPLSGTTWLSVSKPAIQRFPAWLKMETCSKTESQKRPKSRVSMAEYALALCTHCHLFNSVQFKILYLSPGRQLNACGIVVQTQNKSASKEHGQHVKYRRQHASYTDPNQVRQNKHRLNKSNKILIEVQSSTEVGWTVVKRQQQVSANVKIVCSSNTCSQFCKINLKSTCLSVLLQTFSLEHEK